MKRIELFVKLMERSVSIGMSGMLCSPIWTSMSMPYHSRFETLAGTFLVSVDNIEVDNSVIEGYVIEWDVERYEERTAREAVERVFDIVKDFVVEMAADELWAEEMEKEKAY